jgi:4-amino-4-deoxy-L-arabinose transferase-like glycosyltransferase
MFTWNALQRLWVWLSALSLLAVMLLLLFGSARGDSFTFDEPPHITAGYAYLRFRDARLNYEHPPLLKMLAAIPLLPLSLHFPLASPAWQDANNGQWETARTFLYESGNDPHRIAIWARVGPIGLTVGLGLLLFLWTKQWAGPGAALLTLFLYVFSPTILAHGRLVTTDISAAFGVTLTIFAYISFLTKPGWRSALLAGLALGVALLCKFSTFLLIPYLTVMTGLWVCLKPRKKWRYIGGHGMAVAVAAVVVLLCYLWTTAQYPPERQLRDAYRALFWVEGGPAGRTADETLDEYYTILGQDRTRDLRACIGLQRPHAPPHVKRCPAELAIFLADKPVLRAWGHYLYGLVWTMNRASVGTVAAFPFYFLGEVSVTGRPSFFPIVYAVKESLPLHLLVATAAVLAFRRLWSSPVSLESTIRWFRHHCAEAFMLGWLALYWWVSINANLNIGVRHLLPVFPCMFMLVAREIAQWLTRSRDHPVRVLLRVPVRNLWVGGLLLWQCLGVALIFPSFLAYFNEAVGGPARGGHYVVDSNLDWGQDLRRLRTFVDVAGIEKIAVDYFGQSSLHHELGEKYLPWRSALGPYQGWLAVSATVLMVAQARRGHGLDQKVEDSYWWLTGKVPVATVGYSIFVFDLREY